MPRGPQKIDRPAQVWPNVRRILKYMTRRPWVLAVVLLLELATSLSIAYGTYLMTPIINEGILPLVGTYPDAAALQPLARMILTLLAVYAAGQLCSFLSNVIMTYMTNHTLNALRDDLFDRMMDLPLAYFDSHTHGELMAHYTSDVGAIRQAVSSGFTQVIHSLSTLVFTFVMMILISPVMTLTVVSLMIATLLITQVVSRKSLDNYTAQQAAAGQLNGYIEEMMAGQKVVKVFTREPQVKRGFDAINEKARRASTRANVYAGLMGPIANNLSHVNYAVAAVFGCWLVIRGSISLGALASYLQYTRSFSDPLTQIMQQFNSLMSAVAGAERIFKIIDMAPETDEGKTTLVRVDYDEQGKPHETGERSGRWAWKQPTEAGGCRLVPLRGDVRFEDVTFSYDGKKDVLHDVSFYAKPGQKIALVGATGAGKTTITNLIDRFYDVAQGRIVYDGIDVRDIAKASLRSSLAFVLQDTHLFTGTVRDNIRYGRLDAGDAEVEHAAVLANADEFIRMLPQGYDTMLEGDGANLSQGQRQLLAIARAAVADAPVLVLDEATSSIDTRTEALIEEGMDNLMKGRTVFVIAHRLSTVRNANAILVMDHGRIIERGDHDDLLRQKGQYYKLYTGQFELD
jgi:ATP-binding cassette subfamily B protein